MKKGFLYILLLICCGAFFSGCLKHGTDRTISPMMTADIGAYAFTADYVQPTTIKPQFSDSTTSLVISGTENSTGKRIQLVVVKFTNSPGSYSIADKKAQGAYTTSSGVVEPAVSGVVTIKEVGDNTIMGYFTMTTIGGSVLTNGTFVVGKPWAY